MFEGIVFYKHIFKFYALFISLFDATIIELASFMKANQFYIDRIIKLNKTGHIIILTVLY